LTTHNISCAQFVQTRGGYSFRPLGIQWTLIYTYLHAYFMNTYLYTFSVVVVRRPHQGNIRSDKIASCPRCVTILPTEALCANKDMPCGPGHSSCLLTLKAYHGQLQSFCGGICAESTNKRNWRLLVESVCQVIHQGFAIPAKD